MKELHLVIVSPEKLVYEGKVSQATFPGSAGKFQVMADHAPLISTLSAGEVKYVAGQEPRNTMVSPCLQEWVSVPVKVTTC
jgi:F-type H+-transporting ATPase subunit epsilon